jgi:hypothetical protein
LENETRNGHDAISTSTGKRCNSKQRDVETSAKEPAGNAQTTSAAIIFDHDEMVHHYSCQYPAANFYV